MTILNEPNDGWDYEFTVVKVIDMNKEIFEFIAHYDSIFDDSIYSPEEDYIILHDVRIQHKRKKNN